MAMTKKRQRSKTILYTAKGTQAILESMESGILEFAAQTKVSLVWAYVRAPIVGANVVIYI